MAARCGGLRRLTTRGLNMAGPSENHENGPRKPPPSARGLKHIHQNYEVLVENSPDSICVHTDGVIVYVNRAMLRLLGAAEPEELLGTTFLEVLHRKHYGQGYEVVRKAIEQTEVMPRPVECSIVRLDGTVVDVDVVCAPVTYDGRPSFQAILRDITERKKAEHNLRESDTFFRPQFELGNIGIAITSPDKRWLRVNTRLCSMLGYSEKELLNTSWAEITHPDDLTADVNEFDRMLSGEREAYEINKRFIKKDGTFLYTHLTVSCTRNQDRSASLVMVSIQDITEYKRAEQALKESEGRLRFLLDNAPVGITVSGTDGGLEGVNDRFIEMIKAPSARAALDLNSRKSYTGDEEHLRLIELMKKEGIITNYETVLTCFDGSYRDVNITMKPIKVYGRDAFVMVFLDVTEHKRAEEALRTSEETQRALMNASPDAMFLIDANGTFLAMNNAQARRFGTTVEKLLGVNLFSLLPAEVGSKRRGYLEEARRTGQRVDFQDQRDGMWLENTILPIFDGSGAVARIAFYSRDITERKQREDALRLAEFSIEHSGVTTIWFDRNGRVMRVNKAASAALGYSREEFLHMAVRDFDPHFQTAEKWDTGWEWVKSHPVNTVFQSHHRHKSGRVFPVEIVSSFFDYEGQEYIFSFIHDIAARKEAEEQLQQALHNLERSNDELAQFAYVASHDLQEPLRMVASFVGLLAKRYQGQLDERADSYIRFAVEGASRMQSLIQGLLSYSRVHTHGKEPVPVDCAEVMKEVLSNLSQMTVEKKATVRCQPLPVINADRTQIMQLFQNLLTNAMTFHSAGPCVVEVESREEKEAYLFSVRDNGIGIEPQYYDRIFSIFQRLNPRNKYPGTGIGLSICKRIVERHGGRIWVESQPGKGSTFFFTIPQGGKP